MQRTSVRPIQAPWSLKFPWVLVSWSVGCVLMVCPWPLWLLHFFLLLLRRTSKLSRVVLLDEVCLVSLMRIMLGPGPSVLCRQDKLLIEGLMAGLMSQSLHFGRCLVAEGDWFRSLCLVYSQIYRISFVLSLHLQGGALVWQAHTAELSPPLSLFLFFFLTQVLKN